MPQPTNTVPEYCGGLTRSRLLPGERVSLLYDAWHTRGAGDDRDVDGFRKFLVAGRHLTEYQAALLQRGHTEGFLIGGYVILDRVGKGQTAGVYKAAHPGSGQVVALKVLPGSRARNPATLARFQREGRLLTQLDHPNVVRAFQVGQAGVHFIVMEHLDGETVDEMLARRGSIPPGEAARLVVQALHGLQHLHDKRLVHRDLKPANLMLVPASSAMTFHSTLKILDIGLGREFFDESAAVGPDQITDAGTMLGTPDYLAPEQARDARTADVRADIYSLGCVLFHLLAGQPPFADRNIMSAMVRHATEPPPPIAQVQPAVLSAMTAVLEKMLSKKPEDRYATPADAAAALAPFVPDDANPATSSKVIPAFQQWLTMEQRDYANGPVSSARISASVRSGPVSSTRLASPMARGPMSGTRLGMGYASGLGSTSTPTPIAAPPLKPPSAAPRPAPVLVPPSAESNGEPRQPDEPRVVYVPPVRALWDLDRRDFMMLGLGAGVMFGAIAIGIFGAKFVSSKIRRGPEEDE